MSEARYQAHCDLSTLRILPGFVERADEIIVSGEAGRGAAALMSAMDLYEECRFREAFFMLLEAQGLAYKPA